MVLAPREPEEPSPAITPTSTTTSGPSRSRPAAGRSRRPFEVRLGRWHDQPIGPHPCGSYQIEFGPELFAELIPWLALNRQGLTVFVHPETGDAIADHSAHVIWLGDSRQLNLAALG